MKHVHHEKEPLLPWPAATRKESPGNRRFMALSSTLFILLLLGLACVFCDPDSMSAQPEVTEEHLSALSSLWGTLRTQPSHFSIGGGDYDSNLDGFKGQKFAILKELGAVLSVPSTPAVRVLEFLGQPDTMTRASPENGLLSTSEHPVSIETMPGPVVGQGSDALSASQESMYWVYYWRGPHDFLWFKIGGVPDKEVVLDSGFYHALE